MKKLNNKGFSLVELIIVIAIMVVLVGVLAPQFIKYVESSKQSTDIQNASEIRAAIEAYVAEKAPSNDITVSVAADGTSGKKIVIAGGDSNLSTELGAVGLGLELKCKSDGWKTGLHATYGASSFKWTTIDTPSASGYADKANSKAPGKEFNVAFK